MMFTSHPTYFCTAGRAPQFDQNKHFDIDDDDFAPDGEVTESEYVRQALSDRRQSGHQN